jgi:hypothetical protein
MWRKQVWVVLALGLAVGCANADDGAQAGASSATNGYLKDPVGYWTRVGVYTLSRQAATLGATDETQAARMFAVLEPAFRPDDFARAEAGLSEPYRRRIDEARARGHKPFEAWALATAERAEQDDPQARAEIDQLFRASFDATELSRLMRVARDSDGAGSAAKGDTAEWVIREVAMNSTGAVLVDEERVATKQVFPEGVTGPSRSNPALSAATSQIEGGYVATPVPGFNGGGGGGLPVGGGGGLPTVPTVGIPGVTPTQPTLPSANGGAFPQPPGTNPPGYTPVTFPNGTMVSQVPWGSLGTMQCQHLRFNAGNAVAAIALMAVGIRLPNFPRVVTCDAWNTISYNLGAQPGVVGTTFSGIEQWALQNGWTPDTARNNSFVIDRRTGGQGYRSAVVQAQEAHDMGCYVAIQYASGQFGLILARSIVKTDSGPETHSAVFQLLGANGGVIGSGSFSMPLGSNGRGFEGGTQGQSSSTIGSGPAVLRTFCPWPKQ